MQPLLIDDILHGQTAETMAWVAERGGCAAMPENVATLAFSALGASGSPAIGAVWFWPGGDVDQEVSFAATEEATPQLWGQVWDYAFRQAGISKQGLARVTTQIDASNTAAVALAKAQGFLVEGTKKRADGRGGDVLFMGLLKEDCRSLPALSPAEKVFREERSALSIPTVLPDPPRVPRKLPEGANAGRAGVITGDLAANAFLTAWVSAHFDGQLIKAYCRAFGFSDPDDPDAIVAGCYFWDHRPGRDLRVTAAANDAAAVTDAAVRDVLKFPFSELKVPRITAEIDLGNTRALSHARQIGFVQEGVKRRASASGGNMGLFGLYR